MTIIELVLVLIFLGVVVFWPGVEKTGKPLSKPVALLVTAFLAAFLVLVF